MWTVNRNIVQRVWIVLLPEIWYTTPEYITPSTVMLYFFQQTTFCATRREVWLESLCKEISDIRRMSHFRHFLPTRKSHRLLRQKILQPLVLQFRIFSDSNLGYINQMRNNDFFFDDKALFHLPVLKYIYIYIHTYTHTYIHTYWTLYSFADLNFLKP